MKYSSVGHRATLLCLAGALASVSCKQSSEHAGPMPQPTKEPPAGFSVDTSKRFVSVKDGGTEADKDDETATTDPVGRPPLPDALLKELKRSLPAIAGARVLEALKATPHSRLVRTVLCVDQPVAETTSLFLKAYKRKEWTEVTVHTPPHDDNRRTFTANSKRFRLNGSTSQSEFDDCKKSLNQSRVGLSFQERQPAKKAIEAKMNPLLSPAGKPRMTPTLEVKSEAPAAEESGARALPKKSETPTEKK